MTESEFAFGKKLGVHEMMHGNHFQLGEMILRLFQCMKETNSKYGVTSEFFRLDFRNPHFDERLEFPMGCLILDLKWGSKKELEKLKEIK